MTPSQVDRKIAATRLITSWSDHRASAIFTHFSFSLTFNK
jgi:hypothetical protein